MSDESAPQSEDRGDSAKERMQPQEMNTRLRDLYRQLQEKLATGPDLKIREQSSETARHRVDEILKVAPEAPEIEAVMSMQNFVFVKTAQLESTREILGALRAGIRMSVITPEYQECILENIAEYSIYPPDYYQGGPINIDRLSSKYGVGKPGTTGIFSRDSARELEVSEYQSQKYMLDLLIKFNPSAENRPRSISRRDQIEKWESAIESKYGLNPNIGSTKDNL